MKLNMKVVVIGAVAVSTALLVPAINAVAHEGTATGTATSPSLLGDVPADSGVVDSKVGKVTDAAKGSPALPEVEAPGHKATLAEVKAKVNPQNNPRTTVVQNPDGTFTVTHTTPVPAGRKLLPPPVGGYDNPDAPRSTDAGAK